MSRGLVVVLVPAAALAVALAVAPDRAGLFAHLYAVVVAAGALAALVVSFPRALRPEGRCSFERALAPPSRPAERVQQLIRTEREVAIARQNAFDLHYRLRPTLREVAAGLLAARRGISLDSQPERASSVLGPDAWELVRADRPGPEDRFGAGIGAAELDRVLTSLERL